MANREACQVWIDQRIEEEHSNGTPHAEIGRIVSKEILKYFETSIKPRTVERQSRRVETNVSNDLTTENDSEIENNQSPLDEIKAPRSHRITGEPMGGKRKGAGRPSTKPKRPQTPKEQILEDRFKKAFDQFYYEVQNAKMEKWEKTTKESALYHTNLLTDLITIS